jgi:two-component system, cell cycle response regulator DivK
MAFSTSFSGQPDQMPKVVLLADDQEDNRIIFATILEYGGYTVLHAVDGIDAVEKALRHRPALILMDLRMPRMDGWAAVAELQRDARTVSIPVIAISAHGSGSDATREALQAGCVGYLSKPIDPRHLLAVVRHWLDDLLDGTEPALTPPG